ncbi:MAG TPA: hypothetical protein VIH99_06645 [Bdellovibrionota bacterium]|jgi:hypothetical protein
MLHSKVHWGAIFAGAFIGMSGMVFFSLFGLAVGISGMNVVEPLASTITLGAAAYAVFTAVVSFALAGYCTVRLVDMHEPARACLHALTAFATAGVFVPFFFTRAVFVGAPGFALAPNPGTYLSPGLAWTIFLTYALAAVACCGGGVQACYREGTTLQRMRDRSREAA